MIDKIKNATATDPATLAQSNNNETGTLAAANANANANDNDNNYGAKTNADLAAAISAVNKVLGVLDFIIRKPVAINLDKIREAVKGIQYSETTTESTEASTTRPTVTK
ncbi:Variable major protein (plasmid) [Borrelia nietonii YOR]|uniref:Variable major protein n=1 Tax=Borrelia nietonii YOR TaxID=1293576 RepID=W5SB80_9SPIR|nr:Variable major protein [Borrelia nietonii YOR]